MANNPQKKHNESERRPLTMEQAQILLEAAQEKGLGTLIQLALVTGMRRGELLGLKWADIDFAQGTLQVQRTLVYKIYGECIEAEPKTNTQRLLQLPSFVIEILKLHQDQQQEQRVRVGVAWQDRDFVFPGPNGGPLNPLWLHKQFACVLEDTGLPHMRFHDLRYAAGHLTFQ